MIVSRFVLDDGTVLLQVSLAEIRTIHEYERAKVEAQRKRTESDKREEHKHEPKLF